MSVSSFQSTFDALVRQHQECQKQLQKVEAMNALLSKHNRSLTAKNRELQVKYKPDAQDSVTTSTQTTPVSTQATMTNTESTSTTISIQTDLQRKRRHRHIVESDDEDDVPAPTPKKKKLKVSPYKLISYDQVFVKVFGTGFDDKLIASRAFYKLENIERAFDDLHHALYCNVDADVVPERHIRFKDLIHFKATLAQFK